MNRTTNVTIFCYTFKNVAEIDQDVEKNEKTKELQEERDTVLCRTFRPPHGNNDDMALFTANSGFSLL